MSPLFDPSNAGTVGGISLLLGLLSLSVTIAGFVVTLRQIFNTQTKTAAVEYAVGELKKRSELHDSVKELERSLVAIESAMRSANAELWDDVYDYCEAARSSLHKALIASSAPHIETREGLDECHKELMAAMTHIGRARLGKRSFPDVSKLRDQLLMQVERIRICQKSLAAEIQ